MPIYEYECEQCGVRFEKLQRMVDPALTECPECSGHVHRVMQPVGVIFKGSGFYITDYRSDSYKQGAKQESGPAASPAPAKSEPGGGSSPAPSTAPVSSPSPSPAAGNSGPAAKGS